MTSKRGFASGISKQLNPKIITFDGKSSNILLTQYQFGFYFKILLWARYHLSHIFYLNINNSKNKKITWLPLIFALPANNRTNIKTAFNLSIIKYFLNE